MNTGRNDPCPCGSGLKYKKCCMKMPNTGRQEGTTADVFAEIREEMGQQKFSSLQEVQAFVDRFTDRRNRMARDDFQGLSPEQMFRLLHSPFDSPDFVTFQETLETAPTAPILRLFGLIIEGVGEKGLKQTANGNLPRNFCRDAALGYWGEEEYRHMTTYAGINKEEDFFDLHVTRLVAELAGLIRKDKGRFILSRKCRSLLAGPGGAGIYPLLFRAYTRNFNWAYVDRHEDLPLVQQSFVFTLYLLHRFGGDWMPQRFYEDCFLRAFPMILEQIVPSVYFSAEESARSCYSHRALHRFTTFLGLAEVQAVDDDEKAYPREYRVRKIPLLDEAVQYHVAR